MSIRKTLQLFATRPRNVTLLIAVAALVSLVRWRDWKAAPVQRHIETGVQLLQSGHPAAATGEWREAVRLEPTSARAWELLGEYYQAAEVWPAANDAFHRVSKLSPDTPNLQAHLAMCALKMNDLKTAQQLAQVALQQDANDAEAVQVLAIVAQSTGRGEDELKYLRQLVELQPQDAQALATLANELTTNGDYDQARPLIERILKIDPKHFLAYKLRGLAYLNGAPTPQGLGHAQTDFEKVLELNPLDAEAPRYLGRLFMRQGKPRLAIKQLEAISRKRPYASAHFMELANAYRKAGDAPRADALLQRFATLKKLNFRMQDLRDRILPGSDNFDNELSLGWLLLRCVTSDADSYNMYRFRYVSQQIKTSDFYLQQALQARPHDPRALAAMRQLESAYKRYLQVGLQDLQRHAWKQANGDLAHLVLLRPDDLRTRDAIRQAAQSNAIAVPRDVVLQAATEALAGPPQHNPGVADAVNARQP